MDGARYDRDQLTQHMRGMVDTYQARISRRSGGPIEVEVDIDVVGNI